MGKSQVTYFILLGCMIFLIIVFLAYIGNFNNNKISTKVEVKISDIDLHAPVKIYVDSCLKEVFENSLGFIGVQGGYYEHPEHYLQDRYFFFSYYLYNKRNVMPPQQIIEKEISNAVNKELPYCIDNFSVFNAQGMTIRQGPINSITKLTDGESVIDVVYPLEISRGAQSDFISSFRASIPVRLKLIYDTSNNIINQEIQDDGNLCLSCIMQIGDKYNLTFQFVSIESNETLVVVTDNQSILKREPYSFMFLLENEN